MVAPSCSVVIPTKNAGSGFAAVLDAVLAQDVPGGFDVLVVDSGSTDETVDVVAQRSIRMQRIEPETFNHGGTRNLGASMTDGEFIVFLTQDAHPAGDAWMHELVRPFRSFDDVVGTFGRHLPHPGCAPIDARNIERHFAWLGSETTVHRAASPEEYARNRRRLDYFSNNNSALRREAWRRHPFEHVMMAEDQRWAGAVIRAGLATAYVPSAAVYHSHSYGALEWCRRWFDEFADARDRGGADQMRSPLRAAGHLLRSSVDDVRYLRGISNSPGELARLGATAVAHDLGRTLGAWMGSNYPLLPGAARRRLSMQQRIRGS